MSVLSDRLRQLRGESSQVEMARQLGIQRTQWIKYENGETAPGAEIIARICRVHACSADWLLGLSGNFLTHEKVEARAGAGGIAIAGSGNRVTGVVAGAPTTAACAKCPYKKKLKALEKAFKQTFGDLDQ